MPSEPSLWDELGLPRLELESLQSSVRKTLENYSNLMEQMRQADFRREAHLPELANARPMPFSEFGFVDSWKANAYVDGVRNDSLVTFTAALPFAIRDWFDYLLFDKRILQGHNVPDSRLGHSSDIEKPPEQYDFLRRSDPDPKLTERDGSIQWVSYSYQDYRPPSERTGIGKFDKHPPMDFDNNVINREMLAEELVTIAAHFMLFHEIAHVTQGHLRYRIAELNTTRFAEMSSEGLAADDPKTLQALEVDADLNAILRMFQRLKPADDPLFRKIQARTPIDIEVERHIFALGVLLMLLQRKAPSPRSYELTSHPPHVLRFDLICHTLVIAKSSLPEKSRPLFDQGVVRAVRGLFLAAELLDASSIVPPLNDPVLHAHKRLLLGKVEALRPVLLTHAPKLQEIGDELLCRRETARIENPNVSPRRKLESLVARADVQWSRGDLDAAIQDYQRGTQLDGLVSRETAFAHLRLANALAAAQRDNEAFEALQKALDCNEGEVASRAFVKRAEIYERQGRLTEAEADLDRGVCYSSPQNVSWPAEQARARLARARFLSRQSRFDLALADLRLCCVKGQGGSAAFFVEIQLEIAALAARRRRLLPAIWHCSNVVAIEKLLEIALRVEGSTQRLGPRAIRLRARLRYGRNQLALAAKDVDIVLSQATLDSAERARTQALQSEIRNQEATDRANRRDFLLNLRQQCKRVVRDIRDITAELRGLAISYRMRSILKKALEQRGMT